MKSKNKYIVIIVWGLALLIVVFGFVLFSGDARSDLPQESYKEKSDEIPSDYIAVFHGGSGEITYETYIYKVDNGHPNSEFKYINVTSTTESFGSTNWTHKITGRGEFMWTDGAFAVAYEHGAYSYVTLPNNSKRYTIEEYQSMFLMN